MDNGINERGIWMSKDLTDTHAFDKSLSDALVFKYKEFITIVDIGCGNGKYVKNFNDHGIACIGFDGSPLTPEITGGICEVMDFSEPVDIGKFEMVLCLEVGEHIPRQYEEVFIDNVCHATQKKIVMSWAAEGQGGNGHYNERNNDYVINEMRKRGFDFNQEESDYLRKESCVCWFSNTIMVFDKEREPVSVIFFSCRRIEILKNTVKEFLRSNTYPIYEIIIVNDSADEKIHDELRQLYPDFTLVLHPENGGLMKSIDLGYLHIKTNYFYHCEDDWTCNGKGGFLEQSLDIMESRDDIEEVWLADYNAHPLEPEILVANKGTKYRLAGHDGPWHGFTTACGLKRLSDYKRVTNYALENGKPTALHVPYNDFKGAPTIWHKECNIGLKYFELGYRTAVLTEDYVYNTGLGQSEYITGLEK
jgi:hypothetical protein